MRRSAVRRRAAGGYTLTAPIAGVVTAARRRRSGQLVDAERGRCSRSSTRPRCGPSSTSPRRDLALVARRARPSSVTVDGLAGERSPARSTTSRPRSIRTPAPRTRASPLDNPDGLLRANMFGSARIAVGGDRDVRRACRAPPCSARRASTSCSCARRGRVTRRAACTVGVADGRPGRGRRGRPAGRGGRHRRAASCSRPRP